MCVSQKQSSSGLVIFSSRLCMQSTYYNTTLLNFTLYYTCCVYSIYLQILGEYVCKQCMTSYVDNNFFFLFISFFLNMTCGITSILTFQTSIFWIACKFYWDYTVQEPMHCSYTSLNVLLSKIPIDAIK